MLNIVQEIREAGLSEVDDNRCNHLWQVLEEIADRKIEGDLVETGVYKGGTSIIMAYFNKQYKLNKRIWCCDSFKGCPDPKETRLGAHHDETHGKGDFTCDLQTVKNNFMKYEVLSKHIEFVEGWFEDTMPRVASRIDKIALLRFDGDLYSSTLDVLNNLYPKVVSGGFIIIDDFCLPACEAAVREYLNANNLKVQINNPLNSGDTCGSWWIKP